MLVDIQQSTLRHKDTVYSECMHCVPMEPETAIDGKYSTESNKLLAISPSEVTTAQSCENCALVRA